MSDTMKKLLIELKEVVERRIEERVKELEWAISRKMHMMMEEKDGAIRELRWVLSIIERFEAAGGR